MKKSLIALLVVLALIVTVSVFSVGAEETIEWLPWDATASENYLTTLPTSGNYYLTEDMTLTGNQTTLTGDLYLDLNGCTVTKTDKYIYNAAAATLRIKDSQANAENPEDRGKMVVTNTTTFTSGCGMFANSGGTIIIESGIFDGSGLTSTGTGNSTYGSGLFQLNGTLIINGGTFYGMNMASGYGTVIGARAGSNVTINDGTFYGGSTNHGGVIYSVGTLTITGGNFTAGAATGSGGVAYCTGDATISGGTFTAASKTNYGGFFRFDKNATITGVTLSGGSATTMGDNIAFCSAGTLTIGKDAVIEGGIDTRSSDFGSRIVLQDNAKITAGTDGYGMSLVTTTMDVSELNDDAKVYVRSDNTATFIDKLPSAARAEELVEKAIIVSGDSNYNVVAVDDRIVMQIDTTGWTEWNQTGTLPTAPGSYKLVSDVTLTNAKGDISANVKLDLNGHTVTNTITQTGASYVYQPAAGYTLLITDSQADAENLEDRGKVVATSTSSYNSGCGMFATKFSSNASLGKIIIDNGIFDASGVTSISSSTAAGLFQINGDLIINGGTFKGMAIASGKGTVVGGASSSNVEINGGTFYGNDAVNGGIICSSGTHATASIYSSLSISGGTFYNETADGTAISASDIIYVEGTRKRLSIKDVDLTGGVEVKAAGAVTLAGDLKIDNLTITPTKIVNVSGLSTDAKKAKVCVTYTDTENAFTTNLASAAAAKELVENGVVVSADNDYLVVVTGNALGVAQWQLWNAEASANYQTSLPTTAGNWRLTDDVGVGTNTTLNADVYLDLNGKTVTYTVPTSMTTAVCVYNVGANCTLRITDTSTDPNGIGTVQVIMAAGRTANFTSGCGMFSNNKTNSTIIIDNGIFDGRGLESYITTNNACGIFQPNGNLIINGGTFYGMNSYKSNKGAGTVIGGMSTSNVVINGGTFTGNSVQHGGVIYTTGVLTINGGSFTAGTVSGSGGIIYANNTSNVTITGGTYTAASKTNYGGLFRFDKDATITGVTLSGATSNMGNIIAFCSTGTLTIGKDAVITGGIETRANESGTKIVLKDNAKILPGTSSYALKLISTSLDVSGLNDQAEVHVNPESTGVAFTLDLPSVEAAEKLRDNEIVISDVDGWYVDVIDKALALTEWQRWTAKAAATVYGGEETAKLHQTKLPKTAGSWRLIDSVTTTEDIKLSANLELDLNGQTVTYTTNKASASYFYNVQSGYTLTIDDSQADAVNLEDRGKMITDASKFDGTYTSGCGMLASASGGTLIINNGIFDGSSLTSTASADTGAGILQIVGNLTINDGTFYGMSVPNGYGTVIGANANAVVTINDGTFYGNTAKFGGIISAKGTLIINSGLFDGNNDGADNAINPEYPVSSAATSGGLVVSVGAEVEITGGTFQNGKANKGGLLYADGSTDITITGGTFQNGHAIADGGNLYLNTTPSDLVDDDGKGIRNATFIGGTANGFGGSVYAAKAAAFTDCSFQGGIAGEENVDKETGAVSAPTTNGRGGNLYINANSTLTDCTITDGEAYTNSSVGGGNVFYGGGTTHSIQGCTIADGYAYNAGGNINVHVAGATLTIGDSANNITEISGGQTNVGGNIALTAANGSVLNVGGATVITDEHEGDWLPATGGNGRNIHATSGKSTINLMDDVEIKSSKNNDEDSNYYNSIVLSAKETTRDKITLSGRAKTNSYIVVALLSATDTLDTPVVTLKADYEGSALVITRYGNFVTDMNGKIVPGENVPAGYLGCDDGYNNTANVKVHNQGRSGFLAIYDGENFKVAGVTVCFEEYDAELGEYVIREDGIVALEKQYLDEFGFDPETHYIRLYKADTYDIPCAMTVDIYNRAHTFNNPYGYDLDIINTHSRNTATFTVNGADVKQVAQDPVTGYTYLNIQENDGTWSSNCVKIELKGVSLRPTMECNEEGHESNDSCGVYYTAKITANEKVAPYIRSYGIVAGLPTSEDEVIDENFMTATTTSGAARWRWTSRKVDEAEQAKIVEGEKFNSGMIANIMCTNVNELYTNDDNAERGAMKIAVKVYAVIDTGEETVTILSGEQASYSVQDMAEKLAESYPTADTKKATAIAGFLNKYAEVINIWVTADDPATTLVDRRYPNLYYYPDNYPVIEDDLENAG